MTPIHIDLRDLTRAHLEEARPHMGVCRYNAPCIIGTLINPPGMRHHVSGPIMHLIGKEITMPVGQEIDASNLQRAFDNGDWPSVINIVRKYTTLEPIE